MVKAKEPARELFRRADHVGPESRVRGVRVADVVEEETLDNVREGAHEDERGRHDPIHGVLVEIGNREGANLTIGFARRGASNATRRDNGRGTVKKTRQRATNRVESMNLHQQTRRQTAQQAADRTDQVSPPAQQ